LNDEDLRLDEDNLKEAERIMEGNDAIMRVAEMFNLLLAESNQPSDQKE
jgi:hypothetical protein